MRKLGFTLIELLICTVILTIGIFAMIYLISHSQKVIRDSKEYAQYSKLNDSTILSTENSNAFGSPNFWLNKDIVYNESHYIPKNILFNVDENGIPQTGSHEIHITPTISPAEIVNNQPVILVLTCQSISNSKINNIYTFLKPNRYGETPSFGTAWMTESSTNPTGTFFRFIIHIEENNGAYSIKEFVDINNKSLSFEEYPGFVCLTYKMNHHCIKLSSVIDTGNNVFAFPKINIENPENHFIAVVEETNGKSFNPVSDIINSSKKYSSVLWGSAVYPFDIDHPYRQSHLQSQQYSSNSKVNTFFVRPFSYEIALETDNIIKPVWANIWINTSKIKNEFSVPMIYSSTFDPQNTIESFLYPQYNNEQILIGSRIDWQNDAEGLIEGIVYNSDNEIFSRSIIFFDPMINPNDIQTSYNDNQFYTYDNAILFENRFNWVQESDGNTRNIKKSIIIQRGE